MLIGTTDLWLRSASIEKVVDFCCEKNQAYIVSPLVCLMQADRQNMHGWISKVKL